MLKLRLKYNRCKLAEAEIKAIKQKTQNLPHLARDILRRDEKIRKEYEALKLQLSASHTEDRETYNQTRLIFSAKKCLCLF